MNVVDLRIKFIQSLEQQIKKELNELQTPSKYIDKEEKILAGRKKDDFIYIVGNNISESEAPTFRNLTLNNFFRLKELKRAMGMLLLFSNAMVSEAMIKIDMSHFFNQSDEKENKASYIEHFWTSYGDFQIRSCSLLDSIGNYLAFVFFGLVDSPLYYDQVIDSIKLKYTCSKNRIVLNGDPFQIKDRESWKVLTNARKRYKTIKQWRNEIAHAFSPLMYRLTGDEYFDHERRNLLRTPTLDANKVLEESKETFYLLCLIPLAANDLAQAFIGTNSYHRNFYL